ncbi:MAG: dihydrofolate reductase [Planctomycetota bacterium]
MSTAGSGQTAGQFAKKRLEIVVAVSENGVIGRDGDLPWRLSADLKRFKQLTMGHPLIMGRKTYQSIGRPLPGRLSIVLTRDAAYDPGHEAVLVANDLPTAIARAADADEFDASVISIIGGGEVYRLALPLTDVVHYTRVHATVEGDATFPEFSATEWALAASEPHEANAKNEHAFTFETWTRTANHANERE